VIVEAEADEVVEIASEGNALHLRRDRFYALNRQRAAARRWMPHALRHPRIGPALAYRQV
jgi:hypothetical protein